MSGSSEGRTKTLEEIADYIEAAGIEIEGFAKPEREIVLGRLDTEFAQHHVSFFHLELPGMEVVNAEYPYNIADAIGSTFDESRVDSLVEDYKEKRSQEEDLEEVEKIIDDDPVFIAGIEALQTVDDEKMSKFDYHLCKEITTPITGYDVKRQRGAVFAFEVSKHLYPESGITLEETLESTLTVVNIGLLGRRFVERVFNIQSQAPSGENLMGETNLPGF